MPESRPRALTVRSARSAKTPIVDPEIVDVGEPNEPLITSIPPAKPQPITQASKFDQMRFTQIRKDLNLGTHNSHGRVLLFILIVILVGAGALFLSLKLINEPVTNNNPNTATDNEVDSTATLTTVQIKQVLLASNASVASNDNFSISDQSLGSIESDTTTATISKFSYDPYPNVTRMTWEFEGLTASALPQVKATYLSFSKTASVEISNISPKDPVEMLNKFIPAIGNVTEINIGTVGDNTVFTFKLKDEGKINLSRDGNKVVLDIKSTSQLETPSTPVTPPPVAETPTPTPTPVPPPVVNPTSKPPAPHYNNVASQSKQYISSEVSANNVYSSTYYYQYTTGAKSFEFSWAMSTDGGTAIPNASAELIESNGINYIEVKLFNLKYDLLHSKGREKATINLSTANSNLVDVFTKGFNLSEGTATFWVQLRKKGDFRLHSSYTEKGLKLVTIEVIK